MEKTLLALITAHNTLGEGQPLTAVATCILLITLRELLELCIKVIASEASLLVVQMGLYSYLFIYMYTTDPFGLRVALHYAQK